jgi:hypothetical protein
VRETTQVEADSSAEIGNPRTATCTLTSAGSDSDRSDIEATDGNYGPGPAFTPAVSARLAMLPLQLLHTFDATGQVVMTCLTDHFFFRYAKITAIKLSQSTITTLTARRLVSVSG